jgi:hypothetical protein
MNGSKLPAKPALPKAIHRRISSLFVSESVPTSSFLSSTRQGGYEASYGRYDIDERAQAWTFHVEGAMVRSLVGKDLKRRYEFSGNQLIVTSSSPDEHWRVAWERY